MSPAMIDARTLPAWLIVFALLACGGAQRSSSTTTTSPAIEALRERAQANPEDAAVWQELAEAEFLGEGDTEHARAAIDHALRLAPERPELHLMSAWEHSLQGRPDSALDAHLAAIAKARETEGDVAPIVAEVALDAIAGLYGMVARYDERVSPVLHGIVQHPGRLGLIAVEASAQRLIGAARRRGVPDDAESAAGALGCLTEWRAVGPFGPYPMRTFDQELSAEGAGALAERYDLGPGIGEQEAFEGTERDCRVRFAAPDHRGPGSTIAETFIEVEHAGPHLLVVDTGSSIKISVDGELRRSLDRRRVVHGAYIYVPLELTAGRHEIELKLMTRSPVANASVILDRPGRIEDGYDPQRGVELPEGSSPLLTLLRARALFGRSNALAAREEIRTLQGARLSAYMLVEQAAILGNDPYLPGDRREQLRRRLLQAAAQRAPQTMIPAYLLATMQQGEREAFEAMAAAAERWPDHPSVQAGWARLLLERDLTARGEAALRHLRELVPDDCTAVANLQGLLRSRQRVTEANALVDALMSCNASSRARFDLLVRQRHWDQARAEIERLVPLWSDGGIRGLRLDVAVSTGDEATERRLRTEIDELAPESESTVLRHVDEQLAAGHRAGAIRMLDEAADRDPAAMHGLRAVRRDLTGRDELEPYRIDGAEVIARFEASEHTYTEPAVLVWDYMVTRVYPDGSARHLVHQIHKIQSEEAIEEFGQMRVGGQVLTLHSIKPDGRRLEPERIRGLDSIPMTDLEIGDYVEYEFLRSVGPRINGGFSSPGWWFDAYDQPFDISKMVVVYPTEMALRVETEGVVPAPVRSERDGLTTVTWTVEQSEPPPQEPNAVPHPPFRSFLRFGIDAPWDVHFLAEHDILLDKDPTDPAVERLVAEILEGSGNVRERITRLHRWVIDNIEATRDWAGLTPVMVHARAGHRSRVLRYMLELAGLPTQFVLTRRQGETIPQQLSRDGIYTSVVLRITPEGTEPLFASTELEGAPWDLLPPHLRGQQGMLLQESVQSIELPDVGPMPDRHLVNITLEYEGNVAAMNIREEYHGVLGAFWRNQLERVPDADLDRMMSEAYVARLFPGADVDAVAVGGRQDFNGPVVIEYSVRVTGYGRQRGDEHFVPTAFASSIARTAAALPTRETSQLIGGAAQKITLRISGVRDAVVHRPIELTGPNRMVYRRTAARDGDTLVVERSMTIPATIVPAAGYAEFAGFARSVTQADSAEISFRR